MAVAIKFFLLTFVALAQSRPQTNEAFKEAIEDLETVLVSKSGAFNLFTNLTFNATLEALPSIDLGLGDIDLELALNNTEESYKNKKIEIIETLFDAKRQVIRALGAIKDQQTATIRYSAYYFRHSAQQLTIFNL